MVSTYFGLCTDYIDIMITEYDIRPADHKVAAERLNALRTAMARQGLDGFIVPHADEYQNEYIPPHGMRLCWVTGFTGSAGLSIIGQSRAGLFVDSRYTSQAPKQVDDKHFDFLDYTAAKLKAYLAEALGEGAQLGFDPRLHTVSEVRGLTKDCEALGISLTAVGENPLDQVWDDQPDAPLSAASPHDIVYAGEDSETKRVRIGATLAQQSIDAALITAPDSIAWLLNIRGQDVACCPLALSTALLHKDGSVDLFINPLKLNDDVRAHLGHQVACHAPDEFEAKLTDLNNRTVLLDPTLGSQFHRAALDHIGAKLVLKDDPCQHPKGTKNAIEVDGARTAHKIDAVALIRYLRWMKTKAAATGANEWTAAQYLTALRRNHNGLRDLSFPVISAQGPNGALPHYSVREETARPIKEGEIYLVDSGGQYFEGTTDVTRTLAIGTPSAEQKDRFTRVLKGMISVSLARFPKGTKGAALDPIARYALWQAGLNFGHGTGHGVGAYLSVHEGPHGITPGPRGQVPLEPGMIVSNEPGYYKEGHYGIRIENLIVVTEETDITGGDQPMLGFETLTLAPIDRDLIDIALLSNEERDWLNRYHTRVLDEIGPALDNETQDWLRQQTAAL